MTPTKASSSAPATQTPPPSWLNSLSSSFRFKALALAWGLQPCPITRWDKLWLCQQQTLLFLQLYPQWHLRDGAPRTRMLLYLVQLSFSNPTLASLDRAFSNTWMLALFSSISLNALPRPTSDHRPILVSISTTIPKSKIFCFENAWLLNQFFLPVVLPAWHSAPVLPDAAAMLAARLKKLRRSFKH